MSNAKMVSLKSTRFASLEQAEEYVNRFSITDKVVACRDMQFKNGLIQIGNQEMPFTANGWRAFLSEVVPGASRFLNSEDCPQDLAEQVVNRMLSEKSDMKRMVRIEQDNGAQPYLKAFLSEGYRPYNNKQFVAEIKKNIAGKEDEFKVLRPSVSGGTFSVNLLNHKQKITLQDGEKNRSIFLGVNYRNGEDGGASVSRLPFSFDRFCENGTIFGRKFIEAVAKRVVHRGADIADRVLEIIGKADNSALDVLRKSYVNLMNTMMTQLYFKHVAERAIYPMKVMPQRDFIEAIPFDGSESRFGFFNRINEYAHTGNHDEEKRMEFERLAGMVVEENLIS